MVIHVCVLSRYLVTYSGVADSVEEPQVLLSRVEVFVDVGMGSFQALVIWDIRTGARMRGFNCEVATMWPVFK